MHWARTFAALDAKWSEMRQTRDEESILTYHQVAPAMGPHVCNCSLVPKKDKCGILKMYLSLHRCSQTWFIFICSSRVTIFVCDKYPRCGLQTSLGPIIANLDRKYCHHAFSYRSSSFHVQRNIFQSS
mmetsp:Transcript_35102/g.84727  ORF Transcript_35102/g.84727 Transcript_35102/m.84727 type:complete len:128 (-) Transcript_35102:798-1181(-)